MIQEMIDVRNTLRKLLTVAALLMIVCCTLMTVQAADTLAIGATVPIKLDIDVKTTSLNWPLDPATSPYTQTIGKASGVWVRGNKNGWMVKLASEKAVLTEFDGTNYVSGGKVLASATSLQLTPVDAGTGETVAISTSAQDLWVDGTKGNWKEGGMVFTQPVAWEDDPLETGKTYHTVLTFTASYP
jgi:hypothetical protein